MEHQAQHGIAPLDGPARLRLAATVMLVRDDPFEVLTVRRHARATFASAIVFPGGVVDPGDYDDEWLTLLDGADDLPVAERAIRVAGIRETFEETSVLLARMPGGGDAAQPTTAHPSFIDTVRSSGGLLPLRDVHPFAHWVTPEGLPKRFDTRFLLAVAPREHVAVFDGGETVSAEWAAPADLIARARDGERSIMFPTLANLVRLAESHDSVSAIAAARQRAPVRVLARVEERPDGRYSVIPADAGYDVTEHRL